MMAAKAAIATSGHNISNANTEGFSRQRVQTAAEKPEQSIGRGYYGRGTTIQRVERVNDSYLDRQIREANRGLSEMKEKDEVLQQVEDIFNEMHGDGLNRLMSRFFNEFRQLSNDPNNEGVRQAVREASQALVNDFHRMYRSVNDVRRNIDSRLEGYTVEINALAEELRDLNMKITAQQAGGAMPNDLLDRRDVVVKHLESFMDLAVHTNEHGAFTVGIDGLGPLVAGPSVERFYVERAPADDQGKVEGAVNLLTTATANGNVTHMIKGGKLGGLLEVRDKTLSTVQERLDELAYFLTQTVNQIHNQGFNRQGVQGINYFKPIMQKERAAEYLQLSDDINANVNNIAAAASAFAPGDNRVALAIANLQGSQIMGQGTVTMDDWFNSIVSNVGVVRGKNTQSMNQQQNVVTQMDKIRDRLVGVSIDEETANLLQFQQVFDASAKVIKIADEMLETVLSLRA